MKFKDLSKLIRAWLVEASGLDNKSVIFDFQAHTPETDDFITLNPSVNVSSLGMAENINNNNGTVTSIQTKRVDMSINAYGPNALEYMINILDSISYPKFVDFFCSKNLSVTAKSSIRNLTFIEENEWLDRRQLDIAVIYTISNTQEVGYFDKIGLKSDELAPSFESENPEHITDMQLILETEPNTDIDTIIEIKTTHLLPDNLDIETIEVKTTKNTKHIDDNDETVDLSINLNTDQKLKKLI